MAAALALSGCAHAPRGANATAEATSQFARQAFCPAERVSAERVVPIPTPPPEIAADPARLTMWREWYEDAVLSDPRQTIAVSGCGAHATFWCWELLAVETKRRGGARAVYVGTTCNEVEGVSTISSRSTTSGPQPKTTASSR